MIFDHIGVVVGNVSSGRRLLGDTLNIREWTSEFDDAINGVVIQFGRDPSGVCYELLEPRGEASPLKAALDSRRAILNHVAYRVTDIATAAANLKRRGCAATAKPKPAIAYGGKLIQFFVTPMFFVIELIEAPDHQHAYDWGDKPL